MPDLVAGQCEGVLRRGWSATVDDYAIAGGWALGGKSLVVGDAGGNIFSFESKSGRTLWKGTDVHKGGMLAMAIHPNGKTIATTGQDGRVLLWNAANGRLRQAIEVGPGGWVEHVAWASNGRLAVALSRQAFVYHADGAEAWRTTPHPSTVSAIAWSRSGELATACYGRVTFFDTSSELRQQLEWKGSLVSMVLHPEGDIVACGSQDNTVHFWRRSTGEDSMMGGYPGKPSMLTFDREGSFLATNGSEAVTVWNFEGDGPEGTRPVVLENHMLPVTELAFAPNATTLASGGRDGAVVVWLLRRGEGLPVGAGFVDGVVAGLHWRPDGRALVALNAGGRVIAWRVRY
ncbi:MAG: hypothetical protein AAGA56_04960 [Myxococcota bacterium]